MKFIEKLKLISEKKYNHDVLKKHKENIFCNKWWCYETEIEELTLDSIEPGVVSVKFNQIHDEIRKDIIKKGFDYDKGFIVISSSDIILDGHHRYFILKDEFGGNFKIKVLRILNSDKIMPNFILKIMWYQIATFFYSLFTLKRFKKNGI